MPLWAKIAIPAGACAAIALAVVLPLTLHGNSNNDGKVFMFVLLPKGQEVAGAAIATGISNLIGCLFFAVYLWKEREEGLSSFSIKGPDKPFSLSIEILRSGLASFAMGEFLLRELALADFLVGRARRKQLFVGAPPDDTPVIHHENQIGVLHRADPLGDHDFRGPAHRLLEGVPEIPLRLEVEGREGIVEDVNLRLPGDGPGDREALFLPTREIVPALLHLLRIGGAFFLDELRALGDFDGRVDSSLIRVIVAEIDIGGDVPAEEDGLLENVGDLFVQLLEGVILDRVPIEEDRAPGHVVIAGQETDDGAFAAAGRSDDGKGLPGFHLKGDVIDDVRGSAGVGERDVLVGKAALFFRGSHALPVENRRGSLEDLLDPAGRNDGSRGHHAVVLHIVPNRSFSSRGMWVLYAVCVSLCFKSFRQFARSWGENGEKNFSPKVQNSDE